MANNFTANEVADMVPEYDSESDITVSDSDDYFPSTSEENSSDESFMCAEQPPTTSRAATDAISDYCSSSDESDTNIDAPDVNDDSASTSVPNVVFWSDLAGNQFTPRFQPTALRPTSIHPDLCHYSSSAIDIFLKLFPESLLMQIAHYTNERMKLFLQNKTAKFHPTNKHEIMKLFGSFFVMSYMRLPSINHYWSTHPSMGNQLLKTAFSRDRFKLLMSKLYINYHDKPKEADKLYYVEDLINCLKLTFQKYRQDSPYQSIDESMTKFKGKCSFKQYLLMKPVKRGIKVWMRCDSQTGYTYNMNVYAGKETEACSGTLGERVVNTLAATIKEDDVTLAFDRFFTSVQLMDNSKFPAVGTVVKNRKNLPKFDDKLKRGEYQFRGNGNGTIAVRWMDTKEVIVLSNCHSNSVGEVSKKQKDGSIKTIDCPDPIMFYRKVMGGVDRADQMAGIYDLDRRSNKWWKKVVYRSLMITAVNSWVIYKELHRNCNMPFLDFLVDLAECLIKRGGMHCAKRRSVGRPSLRNNHLTLVGKHIPEQGKSRRRCAACARQKKEKRTKIMCMECKLPYCLACFTKVHK